jgi:hypothetical protein
VIRRGLALGLLGVVLAGACSSDVPDHVFSHPDLENIVLQPDDAPAGTEWASIVSGPSDLAHFARDADELELLQKDEFREGYLSLFVPGGYGEPNSDLPPLPPEAVFVQGIAGLFESGDGAHSALGRFVDDLRTTEIPSAADVESAGLGDESFGLVGTTPDGSHVLIFAWRRGNLVLSVSGAGDVAPELVRSLADRVDGRALDLEATGG